MQATKAASSALITTLAVAMVEERGELLLAAGTPDVVKDVPVPSAPVPAAVPPDDDDASLRARCVVHWPCSVDKVDGLASAAGVEPQLMYCVIQMMLLSRSNTTATRVSGAIIERVRFRKGNGQVG